MRGQGPIWLCESGRLLRQIRSKVRWIGAQRGRAEHARLSVPVVIVIMLLRNIEYLVCVRTMSGVVQVFGRYTTRGEAATIAELVDGWVEANLI